MMQRSGAAAPEIAGGPAHERADALPSIPGYDVRLRREITHRRLAISLVRRMLRVLTLHVLDAALLTGVFITVLYLAGGVETGQPFLPALVVTFLLSLNAVSAYAPGMARRDRQRLASGVLLAVLFLAGLSAFPPHLPLAPFVLVAIAAAAFVALSIGRALADQAVRQVYARGIGLRRAVIVGSLEEVGEGLRVMRRKGAPDQYVVGHLTPPGAGDPAALGPLSDLARVIDEMEVEEVVVASRLSRGRLMALAAVCFERGAAVFVFPTAAGETDFYAEPVQMGDGVLLRLYPARLEVPAMLVKRAVDLVLATIALVVLLPLIALVALGIRLDTPGPVFFLQERVGLGGRRFRMWKFRSMTAGAEEREAELAHLNLYGDGTFKLRADPRVTRVGRILRRTSLDELPQLINVLRGEMSLVGPRPALVADMERYRPHHFARLSVVPGMTGPWQVSGRSLLTDFEQIVRMEREYIGQWSLLLDLKIMFRTIGVVVRGEGAY